VTADFARPLDVYTAEPKLNIEVWQLSQLMPSIDTIEKMDSVICGKRIYSHHAFKLETSREQRD
jgi:hypothetical protein